MAGGVLTLIVYDIREDRRRDKVRRFLYKVGFSPINKSAYVGRAGEGERRWLAERLASIAGEGDSIVIIPLQPGQLRSSTFITDGEVWHGLRERGIIVAGGEG